MYYDFSHVIDRVIYRYQRVYSHFRIPFPFDYSILFSLHRSYLSLLNAQRKKLEKKRFQRHEAENKSKCGKERGCYVKYSKFRARTRHLDKGQFGGRSIKSWSIGSDGVDARGSREE